MRWVAASAPRSRRVVDPVLKRRPVATSVSILDAKGSVLGNPLNVGYVGYRRKRGGTELRRASFAGFMSLEVFQKLQETRRQRTRRMGIGVKPRSGPTC